MSALVIHAGKLDEVCDSLDASPSFSFFSFFFPFFLCMGYMREKNYTVTRCMIGWTRCCLQNRSILERPKGIPALVPAG